MGLLSGLCDEPSAERRWRRRPDENARSNRSTANQESNPRIRAEALREQYYNDAAGSRQSDAESPRLR